MNLSVYEDEEVCLHASPVARGYSVEIRNGEVFCELFQYGNSSQKTVELKCSSVVLLEVLVCVCASVRRVDSEHIELLPGRAVHVPQFQHRLLLLKRVIATGEVNTQVSALIRYLVPCCAIST